MVPTQDLVILGLLMEGPMHGYELKRLVEERMSQVASIAPGTLYYTLKKLERRGLVVHEVAREGNRPERQVYAVTASGKETFRALLKDAVWADERPYFVFDAALYFYEHVDKDDLVQALAQKLDNIERFHQRLAALEDAYPGRWPFALESLKKKAHLMSAALDTWYRDLKRGVEQRTKAGKKKAASKTPKNRAGEKR